MKYFVEKMPDDDLYKALLTGAPEVDSEWATVVRLAYRAGVKAGTTRHLQRPDFEEGYVNLGYRLSKAVVRRRLPAGTSSRVFNRCPKISCISVRASMR